MFVAGQVLTAAELNVVSDQSVMVFADSSARTAAISSPSEGMVTYLEDTNGVEVYNGSAFTGVGRGSILQVVSTTKTDTFSASVASGAFTSNITGLEATITPSSTSSKILVQISVDGSMNLGYGIVILQLQRDGSPVGVGDAVGSRSQLTAQIAANVNNAADIVSANKVFLDSPNTISSVTYGIKMQNPTGSTQTHYVNRSSNDLDLARKGRSISTITVMEVAG